jgi:hypothetical protein
MTVHVSELLRLLTHGAPPRSSTPARR